MGAASNTRPIDDFTEWLAAFSQPSVLTELGALGICVLLAVAVVGLLRRSLGQHIDHRSVWFGRNLVDGVLFPLLLLRPQRPLSTRSSPCSRRPRSPKGCAPRAPGAVGRRSAGRRRGVRWQQAPASAARVGVRGLGGPP